MKNFRQPGNTVTCVAPVGGVVAGRPYLIGTMSGIAALSAPAGAEFELNIGGVYELPKVSAQAWTAGAAIFWDPVANLATTVTTSNFRIGVATAAAANPSGSGLVRMNPSF